MPKQYVVFGRPVPRIGARRISVLLVGISLFAVFSLLFTLPSAIPTGPSIQIADHKFSIPKSLKSPWIQSFNPFKAPSHPPPAQKNDTYGESHWFANWRWLSVPFSSSITLDENRSLLPELHPRTPIYCYYDHTVSKDEDVKDAESDILLMWRRAWWAQGFKPIILSPLEAMNNPLYEELQRMKADPSFKMNAALEMDLMRWLAWENMGGGLLASYLVFPMGAHDDPLLTYLRRGDFPSLSRWQTLDNGLFAGPKADIAGAVKFAMGSPSVKTGAKDFLAAVTGVTSDKDNKMFSVDEKPTSLAFYDTNVIQKLYPKVEEKFSASGAEGLKMLHQLIMSHLHITWRNLFKDGIAVLKPLPKHTTHMITPAYELANRLAHCLKSPMPSSCPPNNPKCSPCLSSHPMKVGTPPIYRNTSTLFVIGTVPHPYTTATVTNLRDQIDIAWIRRESQRDPWVVALTKELLGTGMSSAPRVLRFKQAVASDINAARSIWLTAEDPLPKDLEWHFGFEIPTPATWADEGRSNTPIPGHEDHPPLPPADPLDGTPANPDELKREPALMDRARELVAGARKGDEKRLREVIEMWNLADTEAWRFARAYRARVTMERKKWEEAEAKYAGGAGTEKGRKIGWGRWLDEQRDRWTD